MVLNYKINEKAKKPQKSIYVRFQNGKSIDLSAKTGLYINNKDWSKPKQLIIVRNENRKEAQRMNKKLKGLKDYIEESYSIDYSEGEVINSNWLKRIIAKYFTQPSNDRKKYYLTDFSECFIDYAEKYGNNNRRLSQRTITKYRTALNYLKKYEIATGEIRLSKVNTDFYNKFKTDYLENMLRLSPATIGKIINSLKLFLREADKKNYKVCQDFKKGGFISKTAESDSIYFSETELVNIYNTKIKDEVLDRARDWLIISCYTGYRVSDLKSLRLIEHLVEDYLHKENIKTKKTTVVPLHPFFKNILKKRNNKLPKFVNEPDYNKQIKTVCEMVGLDEELEGTVRKKVKVKDFDENGKVKEYERQRNVKGIYKKYELVSSHIGRRSFATNFYGRIDNHTLMAITGHSSERQFLSYIKKTPKDSAERLNTLFNDKKYLLKLKIN